MWSYLKEKGEAQAGVPWYCSFGGMHQSISRKRHTGLQGPEETQAGERYSNEPASVTSCKEKILGRVTTRRECFKQFGEQSPHMLHPRAWEGRMKKWRKQERDKCLVEAAVTPKRVRRKSAGLLELHLLKGELWSHAVKVLVLVIKYNAGQKCTALLKQISFHSSFLEACWTRPLQFSQHLHSWSIPWWGVSALLVSWDQGLAVFCCLKRAKSYSLLFPLALYTNSRYRCILTYQSQLLCVTGRRRKGPAIILPARSFYIRKSCF